MKAGRFAVGIDLGTTHCAIGCVDLKQSKGEEVVLEQLPVQQLTAPGTIEEQVLLPSFLYLSNTN